MQCVLRCCCCWRALLLTPLQQMAPSGTHPY
jgi:hypothetical protein